MTRLDMIACFTRQFIDTYQNINHSREIQRVTPFICSDDKPRGGAKEDVSEALRNARSIPVFSNKPDSTWSI